MFKNKFPLKFIDSSIVIIILFALFKLLLHLVFNPNYNFYRDEFYFIACSQNLDFGFVDHPPLAALIVKYSISIFGNAIQAIRFLPAVAGSLTVLFTGLLVRKIGGGKFAIIIASLAVLFSPLIIFSNNVFSAEVFAQFFWALAFYLLLKITIDNCEKCWVILGIVIGIGLQISYSVIFLLFGLLIFILFTSNRKDLRSPYLWLGFSIAVFIYLPNLIWQISNDFPIAEYFANLFNNDSNSITLQSEKQLIWVHPVSAFLVSVGLIYLFVFNSSKELKKYGWVYFTALIILFLFNLKPIYFISIYPVLFIFGSVGLSDLLTNHSLNWLKYVVVIIILPVYFFLLPMILPILSPELYFKYESRMGFRFLLFENLERGKLPKHFADMYGWENLTQTVARVYDSIDEKEKIGCKILAGNLGEAGAIEFYGDKYNLPKVICGHNNYWIWGPDDFNGNVMIVIGGGLKRNMDFFDEVEPVEIIKSEFAWVEESNVPIYICKKLKIPVKEFWNRIKHFE